MSPHLEHLDPGDVQHIRSADHQRTVHGLGHSDDDSGLACQAQIEPNVIMLPDGVPRGEDSLERGSADSPVTALERHRRPVDAHDYHVAVGDDRGADQVGEPHRLSARRQHDRQPVASDDEPRTARGLRAQTARVRPALYYRTTSTVIYLDIWTGHVAGRAATILSSTSRPAAAASMIARRTSTLRPDRPAVGQPRSSRGDLVRHPVDHRARTRDESGS